MRLEPARLGHSKAGITLDLYSHVMPGIQEDAAARVDGALQAALQKRVVVVEQRFCNSAAAVPANAIG